MMFDTCHNDNKSVPLQQPQATENASNLPKITLYIMVIVSTFFVVAFHTARSSRPIETYSAREPLSAPHTEHYSSIPSKCSRLEKEHIVYHFEFVPDHQSTSWKYTGSDEAQEDGTKALNFETRDDSGDTLVIVYGPDGARKFKLNHWI